MNKEDTVRTLLGHLAADLNAALLELSAAYTLLGEAATREKQKAAQKRIATARDNVTSCMRCYQSLKDALRMGL